MHPMILELLDLKILMVTGKGGVGKSLLASVLAQQAADLGKKVCIVQCASEDQIAPHFGSTAAPHELTQIDASIWTLNLDPELNLRDFMLRQIGYQAIVEKLVSQPLVKSFLGVIPGIKELALLGRIFHMSQIHREPVFDLVIWDGFSSGHFLQMMTTPRAVFQSGVVGSVLSETQRVEEFFSRPENCGIVMVTLAEKLVLSEAVDFARQLRQKSPTALRAVIVNKFPQPIPKALIDDRDHPQRAALVTWLHKRQSFAAQCYRDLGSRLNSEQDSSLSLICGREVLERYPLPRHCAKIMFEHQPKLGEAT